MTGVFIMELKIFENEKFGKVRTAILDNDVWFVGKDVAIALGYSNPSNAVVNHVDSEDKTTYLNQVSGSNYKTKTTVINESGLYSLVLSSKLPTAKEFKRWITKDVIPSIRKYGMYATMDTIDKMLADPNNAIKIFTALKEEREAKEKALKLVQEKQEKIDLLSHSKKLYTTSEIAKELGFKSPQELNKKLCDLNIQYKVNNSWLLYSKYSDKGYISIKQEIIRHGSKCSPVVYNSKWTQKGREFILKLLTN
jgi:prophage antirepressor-like protein